MRILAIRGKNLASLAEPFALEFEREPLRSCGLFAITGETGSGKSTILDALCLALYDTFPRVEATAASERSPDPSGELLKTRDPASILRRGAGSGYAEVDFIARNALRYRARCGLQRARGKAGGKLQKRSRSLWRIDTSGVIVETIDSGIEPVNRRIVELTELSFDQFCRTALLAQGDFDAFLRADAGLRADLLEKITGAEIYGRLSQRAYEKARAAREMLAQLEQRQADVGLLSQEERAARLTEIDSLTQMRRETESENATIQHNLRCLEIHAQAQERLRLAETELEYAIRAVEELAPQNAQLDMVERAEPLRTSWRNMCNARETAIGLEKSVAQAQSRAACTQETLVRADADELAARQALNEIQQKIITFNPLWEQANTLDVRIREAQKHERLIHREVESAQAVLDAKQRALDAVCAEQKENLRELDTVKIEAGRCAPARPLADRMPEIDEWLAKRIELSQENQRTRAERDKVRIELDRNEQFLSAIDAADTQDRVERDSLARQIAEREEALRALDEENSTTKARQVGLEIDSLRALRRPAADYARATQSMEEADRIISDRTLRVAALTQDLQSLRDQRAQQATLGAEVLHMSQLAESIADPHTMALRAVLDDGKPCPVCGALEHPFSQNAGVAQELVVKLRNRRDAVSHALDRLDEDIFQREAAAAAARAEKDTAQRQHSAAMTEISQATNDYNILKAEPPLSSMLVSISGAVSRIDELLAERDIETQMLARGLEAASHLRDERDRLIRRFNTTRDALDRRQLETQSAAASQQKFVERAAQLAAALAHQSERIASLDRALKPFLDLCDLMTHDLERDPASVRARLAQAESNFRESHVALDRLTRELAEIELRVATNFAEAQSAAESLAMQKQTLELQRKTLEDLCAMRATLLGGEETSDHRRRFEETLKSLAMKFEQKRNERSAAGEHAAAARSLAEEGLGAFERATQALREAQESFSQACVAAGFAEQTVVTLLVRPQEEISALRTRLRLAQDRYAAACATVAARQQDIEASRTVLTEASRVDLNARALALTQRLETTSAQIGALREQIGRDDAARDKAESLSRVIDSARSSGKLWDEINAAIGSSTGAKFRRFAQSVTLDQLVGLANQRLTLLSPRYRLEKSGEIDSLGLQIVDRDLGDERRSTRSLSGGERFLTSLALALALAGLEGRDSFVDTLFIDEGFGSLDTVTLDVAIDALESLQGQGRKVGVISHVDSLQQRILTKISVERRGGGLSVVRVQTPGWEA